ncbi:hypothetical protein Sjap_017514 [Stephania japonica]|uniref:Uncharacterized protein n=1 Tax=Stephania japonica TaxID=461633 RepID=A0AAP0I6A5_9MAGN
METTSFFLAVTCLLRRIRAPATFSSPKYKTLPSNSRRFRTLITSTNMFRTSSQVCMRETAEPTNVEASPVRKDSGEPPPERKGSRVQWTIVGKEDIIELLRREEFQDRLDHARIHLGASTRSSHTQQDYAPCKIYQKGSKASTNKSSTVIGHQLREIAYNFNSVCAKEGLEEDYMVPHYLIMIKHMNVGEAQGGTINVEEAMPPLMIVNQDHPSRLVPFVPTDDNVANMGSPTILPSTSINCKAVDHDHDVQDVHVNSFSSDFCDIDTEEDDDDVSCRCRHGRDVEEKLQCDFNTTHHHDVVALPNVESMVETTEVLEEKEGVDWLRDFPQFEPADLEFSDWEADAWDNEFVLV